EQARPERQHVERAEQDEARRRAPELLTGQIESQQAHARDRLRHHEGEEQDGQDDLAAARTRSDGGEERPPRDEPEGAEERDADGRPDARHPSGEEERGERDERTREERQYDK